MLWGFICASVMENIIKVDRITMKERYMYILKENHKLSAEKMGLDRF